MRKRDVLHLIEYTYWVTWRLLAMSAHLPAERFSEDRGVTTRDLRATLVHELDAESSWRLALQGRSMDELPDDLRPDDYPDVETLAAHWRREEAEMQEWLDSLSDEQIASDVTPVISGVPRPLWQYLLHVVFHASQQHADAATLLALAGHSPGNIDYGTWVQSTSA